MPLPQHDGALTIAHRRFAWEQLRFANTAEAAVARRQNNLFRARLNPLQGRPLEKLVDATDRPFLEDISDRSVPTWRYTTADFAPHPLRDARPAVLFIRRDLRGRSALLPQDLDVQSVPRKKLRILIRNHAMRGVGSVSENHNLNAVAHVALQGELSL
jgi:hypothetical protein